jgi:hypothetical protein
MSEPYDEIEPDTKDWTWVINEPCPECGFVAASIDVHRLGAHVRETTAAFLPAMAADNASVRPDDSTWSVLEYGCHLRDVHALFGRRVELMLTEDEPHFENWDQDATARQARYDLQDPASVALELATNADAVALVYEGVPAGSWDRRGFRSNGSVFTVDSIGRYHLHDLVHHLWDVSGVRWGTDATH